MRGRLLVGLLAHYLFIYLFVVVVCILFVFFLLVLVVVFVSCSPRPPPTIMIPRSTILLPYTGPLSHLLSSRSPHSHLFSVCSYTFCPHTRSPPTSRHNSYALTPPMSHVHDAARKIGVPSVTADALLVVTLSQREEVDARGYYSQSRCEASCRPPKTPKGRVLDLTHSIFIVLT